MNTWCFYSNLPDGELYAAVYIDFMGTDSAIFRTLGKQTAMRTDQYNSRWLNGKCLSFSLQSLMFSLTWPPLSSKPQNHCHSTINAHRCFWHDAMKSIGASPGAPRLPDCSLTQLPWQQSPDSSSLNQDTWVLLISNVEWNAALPLLNGSWLLPPLLLVLVCPQFGPWPVTAGRGTLWWPSKSQWEHRETKGWLYSLVSQDVLIYFPRFSKDSGSQSDGFET